MPRDPVASGEIPEGGPIELLREVELGRVTGALCFAFGEIRGEIALFGGEIAVDQTLRDDGLDPVDVLLSLSEGTYELHQRLPPLAVSRGDDYAKTGSLAVHVPVDLMNYCEHAGLTGVLELRHEERRAEAFYDAGELLAIELDGQDAADLHEVFAWEQGRFRITLDPHALARFREEEVEVAAVVAAVVVPEAAGWAKAPPKKREDTRQFLRVVEMALADVITESEKARSPTRTSPPLPPPPRARPRPKTIPPLPPRRRPDDHTVRLIYLTGDAPEQTQRSSTRHVQKDVPAEFAITEARPERRADPEHSEPMAKKRKERSAAPKPATDDAKVAPEDEPEPEATAAKTKAADAGAEAEPQPKAEPKAEVKAEPMPEAKAKAEPETSPKSEPSAKPEASASSGKSGRKAAPAGGLLGAAGWALGVFALGLGVLALLAHLPPVSCRPGREVCSFTSGCVDLASDPANCGECGNACASGTCQYGECAD